jgi:hypothetical protein
MGYFPYFASKTTLSGQTALSRSPAEIPQAKTIALPEPISSSAQVASSDPFSVFPHADED